MADPEHLAKLKEGVEAWNAWRDDHPRTWPDLSNGDLSGMDLRGANLSLADRPPFATGEPLRVWVNLHRANLTNANLFKADLRETNLCHADLSKAKLYRTDLTRAYLQETNFSQAHLSETLLLAVDLSDAQNLDSCHHHGPSVIDNRTLMKSGRLPLEFLRGCGLSDKYIEYIPAIFNDSPIELYSTFISYSSKDQECADRLYADLQNSGVRCWLASEDLKIGDRFRDVIDLNIRHHDKLLVVLSEASVVSDWVEEEVETGLDRERKDPERKTVLFPIRIDDAVDRTDRAWATALKRRRHIGDFRDWKNHDAYKKALDRLLRDIKVDRAPGGEEYALALGERLEGR